MKALVQEVRGCSGSFRLFTVSEHSTIKKAREEAKRRNQNIADRRGISLRAMLNDRSNHEGMYVATRESVA